MDKYLKGNTEVTDGSEPSTSPSAKKPRQEKVRQYNVSYLQYSFIPLPTDQCRPFCVICESVLSNEAMKPSRLQDHLHKRHPDTAGCDTAVFRKLKEAFKKCHTLSSFKRKPDTDVDNGLVASYNISKIIAKCELSNTVGEKLVLPCVSEVLTTVLKMNVTNILKSIPLSNNTVSRSIEEMSKDIGSQLCADLGNYKFGIQLDETTVRDNEALLMAYVRLIKNEEAYEEMLFCKSMTTNTKGESMFEELQRYLKSKEIPMKNIISCATDGAPSMLGRHMGLIAFLRKEIPNLFSIHCVIHCQRLVAKKLSQRLHSTMAIITSAINKIKAHSLNSRLFCQLCEDNDEELEGFFILKCAGSPEDHA
ncbi:protein FAM200C-like [Rhineura floridana]|uniref:protein FAM200C-like n=1 Tax=Rhineura floridana TaxID=261503 RepID=UPI002AC83040|nr:protein FAM200C-like [Rhineura floridana]